jgi:hypothetical protein
MRRILCSMAVLLGLIVVLPARASGPDSPNNHTQSLLDGCQRSDAQILTLTTSEWVYVYRDKVLQDRAMGLPGGRATAEGVVKDIHPAGDDLFVNHDFNDVDIEVQPDPTDLASLNLIETGGNTLTTEWEESLIPTWAWPQIGDRVKESGSWIWDCGHWKDSFPGNLTPYDLPETIPDALSGFTNELGEGTELHPLYEMGVMRKDAAGLLNGVPRRLARLDAWISGDGGWALAEEECSLLGIPSLGGHACSRYRDVGGTYSYNVALPPKPSLSSTLVVNAPFIHPETDPALQSTVVSTSLTLDNKLHVEFTIPDGMAQKFGVTVEAGWSDDTTPVDHYSLTLNDVHIVHTLDRTTGDDTEPSQNPVANGPEQTPGPGEWVMFASVNGAWKQVPGVAQVNPGQHIAPGVSFDFYTPSGVPPRLFVSARECDIPLVDCASDVFGGTPSAVPFNELGYNDHPGRIQDQNVYHLGIVLTADGQQHTYRPWAASQTPYNDTVEDRPDGPCGVTCYEVTATLVAL